MTEARPDRAGGWTPWSAAVVAQHLVVKAVNQPVLVRQRGRLLARARHEVARNLSRKPRAALSTTPDHDGVGTGHRQGFDGVVTGFDIAIAGPRSRYRPL